MPKNQLPQEDRQILLAEYETVKSFLILESESIWRRWSFFVLFNSIFMTAAVTLIIQIIEKEFSIYYWLALLVISLVGLLLAMGWILVNKRSNSFRSYWFERLRDIEGKLGVAHSFRGLLNVITGKKTFHHDGKRVKFPGKMTRTKWALVPLVYVIGIIWAVLFFVSFYFFIACSATL